MCDVLCTYPASSIYPAAYAPANSEVAGRRLSFDTPLPEGFLGKVLDPTHPMVMCVMEEASGAAENLKEARLVAAVAVKLRELLPEGSDEEFWAERLFIVSPHHAQIRGDQQGASPAAGLGRHAVRGHGRQDAGPGM